MTASRYDRKGRYWENGKRVPERDLQFVTVRRSADGASWEERIPVTLEQREKLAEEYFRRKGE